LGNSSEMKSVICDIPFSRLYLSGDIQASGPP
jgi:hypothetical protein